jgi:hypothetical protein
MRIKLKISNSIATLFEYCVLQVAKKCNVYQYDSYDVPVLDKTVDSSWKKTIQHDKYTLSKGIIPFEVLFKQTA